MNLLPSQDPLSVPQLLGEIAMAIMVAGNMCKSDRRLNQTYIFSNSLWVAHYVLMHGWPGALACFMHIVRGVGALYGPQGHRIKTFWIMLVLYTVIIVPFVHQPWDIFPLIGSYLMCVAFYLVTGVRTRYLVFISILFWFVYAMAMHSIGGTVGMILCMAMMIRTIGKMRRDESDKIQPNVQDRRGMGNRAD